MPKRLADRRIGERAVEELYRLFPNLTEISMACRLGMDRKSFYEWKNGMTPGGYFLSLLCWSGCDIVYILTGKRKKLIDPDPIIRDLESRLMAYRGVERSVMSEVIEMLKAAPDAAKREVLQ